MSFLDKLWDDTVAGPRPDSGLGKLRKYSTFNSRANSGKESSDNENQRSYGAAAPGDDSVKVTRSIMIARPPPPQHLDLKDSPPVSPAGSTPPISPFSVWTGGDVQVRVVEEEMRIGSGEDQDPFRTRNRVGLDPIALLLLTCEI